MNVFGLGDFEYFCTIFIHFSTIISQTPNFHSYSIFFLTKKKKNVEERYNGNKTLYCYMVPLIGVEPKNTFKKGTLETKPYIVK